MKKIVLIAATGENNALGLNGELPWHLPDDFKRFKDLTSGHKIIMGRKTFETFPKPLPNREHYIISRHNSYVPKFEAKVFASIQEALEGTGHDEVVYIIGGGEIYNIAMPLATHIELTRIHAYFQGDTFFPKINLDEWHLLGEIYHPKDERHLYDFTYQTFQRVGL